MEDYRQKVLFAVKDYTVSKQTFGLYLDTKTDMLITFPQPKSSELASFYESDEYISHTDSKNTLFEKAYQYVRSIALKNKIKLINSYHQNKGTLLDIGSGTGDFLVSAQLNGWEVTGIEPSENARKIASSKSINVFSNSKNISQKHFDVITMWHVLEHVPNLDHQIAELKKLLKPDGTIFIAVPNYKSYDAKYYGRFWAAFDVPRHLWHFSKVSIKILFEKHKMKLKKILPMHFDAFYVALLSEKYKTGKMNLFNALFIGLKSNYKAKKNQQYSSQIYVIKNQ
jgi:2-polyprenyl-3-methyl-5-hydroxy-6-metoxy-1,4-benzoquinol methylase